MLNSRFIYLKFKTMRHSNTIIKKSIRFYCLLCGATIAFFMYLRWSTYNNNDYEPVDIANINLMLNENIQPDLKEPKLMYILVWTAPYIEPVIYMGEGLDTVIERNCSHTNCYVTSDRKYFDSIGRFDAIIFHARSIEMNDLPHFRLSYQKYVFASMESSHNYPICNATFNSFFNWTWTYKLDSDQVYGYFVIRNKDKKVIGPMREMHWMKVEDMQPIGDEIRQKLSTKKHAAAWFVSFCHSVSKRIEIGKELALELEKYNFTLDIYGKCGTKVCERTKMNTCLAMLESDYYFYLAFENSFSEDYVTEKLIYALNHYTVPIVYGAANYTRFMPEGIYLNAAKMPITELASAMAELIKDKKSYQDYFRWHNHYSYHFVEESNETDPYCKFCAMINDGERFETISVYPNFTEWWNPKNKCPEV